ncbi:MAG: GntR family transcriptional regulator [Deinococcales bacterium]
MSGVERVYRALRSDILTLELAPSAPLDEQRLSQAFGLSRTPVREALVRLTVEGLAVSLPKRGTIVAPLDLSRVPAYFDALTLMQRVVSRLAARHHRPGELERAESLRQAFAGAVARSDVLAMIEVNRDFHVALAETGHNAYYTGFYARLLDEGRRMLRLYYASFHDRLPGRYVDEHGTLLAAVKARDEARADRVARRHAEQVAEQIRSLLAAELGSTLELDDAALADRLARQGAT